MIFPALKVEVYNGTNVACRVWQGSAVADSSILEPSTSTVLTATLSSESHSCDIHVQSTTTPPTSAGRTTFSVQAMSTGMFIPLTPATCVYGVVVTASTDPDLQLDVPQWDRNPSSPNSFVLHISELPEMEGAYE